MSLVAKLAKEELERRETTRNEPLFEFITRISPHLFAPTHLSPIVEKLEQAKAAARGEADKVFVCTSTPPQIGKTLTYQHALAQWVNDQPTDFLAYITYNQTQADGKSRKIRDYALEAGVNLRTDSRGVGEWHTSADGGLLATGVYGSITGKSALQCIVVDDPYKNSADAQSKTIRKKVWEDFQSSIWTRRHKRTSVFVNHTRWATDDLIGRIMNDPKMGKLFTYINLPAISPEGVLLCPQLLDTTGLAELRAGLSDYQFAALVMGEPMAKGSHLFPGCYYYTDLPYYYQVVIGVDLAYSTKKASDWSVAVVLAKSGNRYYVLDVVRKQCLAPDFGDELKKLHRKYPGSPMHSFIAGTEKGTTDFFNRDNIPIVTHQTRVDKFSRAQSTSASWRNGEILVPVESPWLVDFLEIVNGFTGVGDTHDDDVDALVTAHDMLIGNQGGLVIPNPKNLTGSTGWKTRGLLGKRGRSAGTW